jgi:hypothetical protein
MAQITETKSFDLTELTESEVISLHLVLSNARAWETGLANVFNAVESVAGPLLAVRGYGNLPNHYDHDEEPPF